ncbi:MAG: hypothetical protein IJH63_00185 [Methanobrevibacter sp.]|nr:hypothetical protein [Methanosphaera sp.]MBR0369121.1 hypothetical protein [Methanobrevibacter sp.]
MFESELELVEDLIKGYGESISLGDLRDDLLEHEKYYTTVDVEPEVINIYHVSTGYQIVNENRVLGVADNFYDVCSIIRSWCNRNGISLRDIVIDGDCI